MVLRTTCIKNVKFKIIKIRSGREYLGPLGYFYHNENFNWGTKKLRLGRMQSAGWTWLDETNWLSTAYLSLW